MLCIYLFQTGPVTYEIIGLDAAPQFFGFNNVAGGMAIFVKSALLATDQAPFYLVCGDVMLPCNTGEKINLAHSFPFHMVFLFLKPASFD